MIKFDFGLVGIGCGETIYFKRSGDSYTVCSGEGKIGERGGTLVMPKNSDGSCLYGLKYVTKQLLQMEYYKDAEWYEWTIEGQTLFERFLDLKKSRQVQIC